jgi:hypothetical protein
VAALRQVYTFRDHFGYLGHVRCFVPDTAAGTSLAADMAALSAAHFVGGNGPFTTQRGAIVFPAASTYSSIIDKVRMTMLDVDGLMHPYLIPVPLSALFLPDGFSVDPTNGLVGAWAASMVAHARTGNDIAFSQFVGGRRVMVHERFRRPAAINPAP